MKYLKKRILIGHDNNGHIVVHLKDIWGDGRFWCGNDNQRFYPSDLDLIKTSVFFLYARKVESNIE